MLIPKFGSIWTFGRGPLTPFILKGPPSIEILVGTGPPAPWVTEYICQPPPMLAVTLAVPLPPAGTLLGETFIESETGFCAVTVEKNRNNKQIIKPKLLRKTLLLGRILPKTFIFY